MECSRPKSSSGSQLDPALDTRSTKWRRSARGDVDGELGRMARGRLILGPLMVWYVMEQKSRGDMFGLVEALMEGMKRFSIGIKKPYCIISF